MHKANKSLGQNFLIDARIIDKIILSIALKKTDNILEIGPGKGAITLPLLEKVNKLYVIEVDDNLVALLKSLKKDNLIIYHFDILKFNLNIMPSNLRIVGNLPYNISSQILFFLLENRNKIKDMTLMLQKEVAERITANKNNKSYGILSVMMQAFFEVELIFIIPPTAFRPIPKVDSAIVYFKPLQKKIVKNITVFKKLIKIAFSKRRKTLKNCLKSMITQEQTSIDLSLRAESLSVNDFIKLSNDYEKQNNNNSSS
jgi:16S rRNA (adenine1518-N6/adenine1519-N6)-dimethyltransferase